MHSLLSLLDGRVRRRDLELITRYLPPGIRRGANRVLPSSWGTSDVRLPCSIPTPAGLLASDHCDAAARPLVCKKQRLPRKVFRSSIAWLSDWLSTLRGVSHLGTTQDSLPVAGQALLDGILTRKVPMKGFKVALYISSPFPKLCLAQLHRPPEPGDSARAQRCLFWEDTSANRATADLSPDCPPCTKKGRELRAVETTAASWRACRGGRGGVEALHRAS